MTLFFWTPTRERFWALMCAGALAVGTASIAVAAPETSNVPQAQILVTGEGTITVAPDLAQVKGGVISRAPHVKEAAEANARAMAAVIDQLVQAGVDRKDIRTAQFAIQPVYGSSEWRSDQKLAGYSVSNEVVAKIRKIENVGDILDRLIAAGVTNIWNLEFLVSDPVPALDQARTAAIADARRKAELYANAAGVKLGAVVSIMEENTSAPGPVLMQRAAVSAGSAAPPILAGENTVRVSVSVGFALAR
jgi:uncharacterized protein YggE